ncbi:hypothetical protein HMI54_001929 [Coelomomyces lativittatus]|nr:hypothetical protein HMI56_000729 [Coelomomyces lativittatus]KAJ1509986.1 hypothetical protein HMI54_001929 [Coelomomyces lativittatus]KAJ1513633.1 hypothetical protein HMI55_005362 [Coelomomyces lativittatus]
MKSINKPSSLKTEQTTLKEKINASLLEKGLWNHPEKNKAPIEHYLEITRDLLNEVLEQRVHSSMQLQQLHTSLTLELEKAPQLDQETLAFFEKSLHVIPSSSTFFKTIESSGTQLQVITKLKQLCFLKERLSQASRALQDALRWSSLSSQITSLIDREDWLNAGTLLLETTQDLELFEAFLPTTEHQRRLHILNDLHDMYLKALSPTFVIQLQTRQTSVLPILVMLQKLKGYCRVQLYQQVRISELESLLSSLEPMLALDALGDWMERESTWLSSTLPLEAWSTLLLALMKEALPFALPVDPEPCFLFLHRMERLLSIHSTTFMTSSTSPPVLSPSLIVDSFLSILQTILTFPEHNQQTYLKKCTELWQESTDLRPSSPTHSPNEELHQWQTALQQTLVYLDQFWESHVSICGPHLRFDLHMGITTLWTQFLSKHLELLPPSTTFMTHVLDPTTVEPYLILLGYASRSLLPAAQRFQSRWESLLEDAHTLPHLLHFYLDSHETSAQYKEKIHRTTTTSHWVTQTTQWIVQVIEHFLQLLLQPIFKHVPKDLLQPVPPPTLLSHHHSMKLPQFSLSPSPSITFVGEYLLQLPHSLECHFTFPHPFVFHPPPPTPTDHDPDTVPVSYSLASLLTLPAMPMDPTRPMRGSTVFQGHDLVMTLGVVLQMEVLRGFYQSNPRIDLRDQMAMDLSYLSNILDALDCPLCQEFTWLLQFIKQPTLPFEFSIEHVQLQHPSPLIMKYWKKLSHQLPYSTWKLQFLKVIKKTFSIPS